MSLVMKQEQERERSRYLGLAFSCFSHLTRRAARNGSCQPAFSALKPFVRAFLNVTFYCLSQATSHQLIEFVPNYVAENGCLKFVPDNVLTRNVCTVTANGSTLLLPLLSRFL